VTYHRNASIAPVEVSSGAASVRVLLTGGRGAEPATLGAGVLTLPAAESLRVVVTPRRPFQKGDKLGAEIDRVVLTPVR
jgi:hypothetical protein